ncbi:hypothetical protein ACTXT7_015425, partial [Hymenolepis weldensis]
MAEIKPKGRSLTTLISKLLSYPPTQIYGPTQNSSSIVLHTLGFCWTSPWGLVFHCGRFAFKVARNYSIKAHDNHHVARLCRSYNITHVYCLPYHPQSNGQTERIDDTPKKTLQNSSGEGTTEKISGASFQCIERHNIQRKTTIVLPKILWERKSRTIHNALLPKDSTFPGSSSCS